MNSLNRIIYYDKLKKVNQNNCNKCNDCNCEGCNSVSSDYLKELTEMPPIPYDDISIIIQEKYKEKDNETKLFIENSLKIYGNKYDYSKSFYSKDKDICIICNKHGEFWQNADYHMRGFGCEKCKEELDEFILKNIKEEECDEILSENEVKDKIIKKFGDIYDLSNLHYKEGDEFVELICPKHTNFQIKVIWINQNGGCPYCVEEKVKKNN